MTLTQVDSAPRIPHLLARAAVTAAGRGGPMPGTLLEQTDVRVDRTKLAAYDRVCRFPVSDVLPPTYPHLIAFPLQLALMTDRSFPLALPGLVHVRNRITVLRPLGADEPLRVQVWAERFAAHRRSATVDLCAAVFVAAQEVWSERSTYLARGRTPPAGAPESDTEVPVGELPRTTAIWRIPADAGRRYAGVSGDVNPIHLSPLTARAFGFPHAIAHGMWIAARALAGLAGRLPDSMSVDVEFHKPVYLPSTVAYRTAAADGGWDVAVENAADAEVRHLTGTVRPG